MKQNKHQERLRPQDVTPLYEDAGLFKNEVCNVRIELVPVFFSNKRDDLLIRGFVKGDLKADVLFAGRRVAAVDAIVQQLKKKKANVFERAARRKLPTPDVNAIRLPVQVEGSWRRRFVQDESGWETRSYHLVAARWAIIKKDKPLAPFGKRPDI